LFIPVLLLLVLLLLLLLAWSEGAPDTVDLDELFSGEKLPDAVLPVGGVPGVSCSLLKKNRDIDIDLFLVRDSGRISGLSRLEQSSRGSATKDSPASFGPVL